jgi:hypothetical protein
MELNRSTVTGGTTAMAALSAGASLTRRFAAAFAIEFGT